MFIGETIRRVTAAVRVGCTSAGRSHLQVHPIARRTAFNLNRLLYLFVAQNRAHVLQRLGSQKYIIVLRADAAAWFTYQSGNLLVGTGWGSVAGAYSLDVAVPHA